MSKLHAIRQGRTSSVSIFHRLCDIGVIILGMEIVLLWEGIPWTLQHTVGVLISVFLFHFMSELDQFYISWRGLSLYRELKKATLHWAVAAGALFLCVMLFAPIYLLPDSLKVEWFFITLLLLISYRVSLRVCLGKLRQQGFNTRSVAIAGAGLVGQKLAANIRTAPWLGFKFIGFYDDFAKERGNEALPMLGDLDKLVEDARNGAIDKVYITLPMRAEQRIREMVAALSDTTVSVYMVPDIFVFELLHARSDVINGVPTISIFDSPLDGSNAILKRVEDIIISSIILLLISPILLGIAAAVKLTSKGPVFFKQYRYGIDGKPIRVWKFRSMNVMENGNKVTQATKNDNRFTPIGGFLRSTSLDELPQFINVWLGDMSIVGPRPHAVAHNEEYRKLISGYMLRHKVKPGITGWAQINGWRGETDTLEKMEKRVEYDLDYIRSWNLWLDLKIIFLTIFKGFINKNAY